jgi:hypothetical protein
VGSRVPIPLSTRVFVSCVCCVFCRQRQRTASATGWSLVQRSPTARVRACFCVCLIVCDVETSTIRCPRLDLDCCNTKNFETAKLPSGYHSVRLTTECNKLPDHSINLFTNYIRGRGGAVGWGTALQTGRSRVRLPKVSLEFFIDIILPVALWPWGRLSL